MLGLMTDAQVAAHLGQQSCFVFEMALHCLLKSGEVKGEFKSATIYGFQPELTNDGMVSIDVGMTQAISVIDKRTGHGKINFAADKQLFACLYP